MDPLLVFTFRHVTLMGEGATAERAGEERERGEGQRRSDWCAGAERERERDLKRRMRRMKGEGCLVVYPVTG